MPVASKYRGWFAIPLHRRQFTMKSEKGQMNYTYILRCGDGSLYTGWTNDLEKRLAAHSAGRGGKYTRSRLPVELVYCEEFDTKEEAMRREWAIKQLTRAQKERLLKENQSGERDGSDAIG